MYTDAANNALLDLVVEEGAEITVARSKMRRSGPDYRPFRDPTDTPYVPNSPSNFESLQTEVYDMMTLIEILRDRGLITLDGFEQHYPKKIAKLERWAPEIFEETHGSN